MPALTASRSNSVPNCGATLKADIISSVNQPASGTTMPRTSTPCSSSLRATSASRIGSEACPGGIQRWSPELNIAAAISGGPSRSA